MAPNPIVTPAPRRIGGGLRLCLLAIFFELLLFAAVLSGRLGIAGGVATLLFHGLGSVLAAYGLHAMMTPSQQVPRRGGLLFLFALSFFMPLFGVVGMLGGLLAERYVPSRVAPPPPWQVIEAPELPIQPSTSAGRPDYGDGALSAMLRYCPSPERRLAAVLAVRHLRDANDAEVLRLALTDVVDDVRLLAYSILDRKEQGFNSRLKVLLGQLPAAAGDDARLAKLEKRLAQTHFELVELGLCRGEVLDYFLSQARSHVEAALQIEADDRECLFLLGRIALRQAQLPLAEQAFLKAQVLGMSLEKVLPHLAELAFRQQRYSMVTYYLRAIDPVCFRAQPQLSGVAAHWLPEEPACRPKS
jgi:hypothetical protein